MKGIYHTIRTPTYSMLFPKYIRGDGCYCQAPSFRTILKSSSIFYKIPHLNSSIVVYSCFTRHWQLYIWNLNELFEQKSGREIHRNIRVLIKDMATVAFIHLLLFITRSFGVRNIHDSYGSLLNSVILLQFWAFWVNFLRLHALR